MSKMLILKKSIENDIYEFNWIQNISPKETSRFTNTVYSIKKIYFSIIIVVKTLILVAIFRKSSNLK